MNEQRVSDGQMERGQVEGAGEAENMLMWSGRCGSSGWSIIASWYRACDEKRERRVDLVQVNGCVGSDGEDRKAAAEVQGI